MSLWQRLTRAFRGGRHHGDRPAAPREELSPDELHLRKLVTQGAGRDLQGVVDRLVQAGRAPGAIAILSRAAASQQDDELLLILGELLCGQRAYGEARLLLEAALAATDASQEQRLRARFLLGEARAATGDTDGARACLDAVLAEELDYPRARGRLSALEPRLPGASAAILPAGDQTTAVPTLHGAGGVQHQRYRLLRELGRGSAGTVYLAHDTELARDLAVKIFHPSSHRADSAAQAWNEARLTAAVRHPGVVAIYDLDDERNLVVMELCKGGTLRQRLQSGRLPARVALYRTRELLDTLAVVHRTGVVHGDLKPGNLLFRGSGPGATGPLSTAAVTLYGNLGGEEASYGNLVVADFGIARLIGADGLTSDEHTAGTLGYLAPERRRHGPLGRAADVYAVGAILLEMLLGALPLSRLGMLRGDPLPAALSGPVLSELGPRRHAVEVVLRRLLTDDPAARPPADEALRQLTAIEPAPG